MEICLFIVVRGVILIRILKMYFCNVSFCCFLNCSIKLIFFFDLFVLKIEVYVVLLFIFIDYICILKR